MSSFPGNISEADILSDVIGPDEPDLPAGTAQAFLNLRFRPPAVARMEELADKNRRGTLTEAEKDEINRYLRVGNFLNLIQAKARKSLSSAS